MRIRLFLLFLIGLTGCKDFETRKITSEEVLELESQSLNWKEVDEYPAFENCKNITEIDRARDCFEATVANSVNAYLARQEPIVTQAIDDTVFVHLEISKTGFPTIESIEVDTLVTNQIPELKLWIQQSIDSLPKIYPASKRGIPVSSIFKMPIVIKAE
ncbi:hypothetical protein FK178_14200 [Antarcticibacterium arcticum]|uniref:TonB C-terminal domain-containing protein n=1 Tax=Antarcticibacterium arcticum TaxID=2585771 RepID=A0A5B8YQS2_9FLAO|nr:hypothetical protein [Antarcticibacterium arcticum]QED38796.1 hypothetical protein FK178_14200 [Antarcticibacterium arcticum]